MASTGKALTYSS